MGEDHKIIELEVVFQYKDGHVYIKKMDTNEIPVTLTCGIIEALSEKIIEHYNNK